MMPERKDTKSMLLLLIKKITVTTISYAQKHMKNLITFHQLKKRYL